MKTQVIHLEAYDDRHSVLDRLNWGQANRVILIWPLRGEPLDSQLDLKLIHRRCQRSDIRLALVCKRREVIDQARGLDIPVFRSLRQAQQIAWEYSISPAASPPPSASRRSRQELADLRATPGGPAWQDQPAVRTGAFILGLLAFVILAGFILPGARIEYLPPAETQTLEINLTASPDYQAFNLSGAVPANFQAITVEARSETESTGEIAVPAQAATGIIQFTNLTDREFTIPAGTILRADSAESPIRFSTTTDVTLQGAAGAAVQVPIEALNPGSAGNLPENSLTAIEGELSRSLTVTNLEPTTGGNDRISPAPSPADYEALREEMLTTLWQTALDEAGLLLSPRDIILNERPHTIVIVEEAFSPAQPEPAPVLTLQLVVEYEIIYLKWEDIAAMGNAAMDATLPPDTTAQVETFDIETETAPQLQADGTIQWPVTFSRQVFLSGAIQPALQEVRGKPINQAQEILRSRLGLTQTPEITLFPEWWPLIPFTEIRIVIQDVTARQP
jgi:hypothetical protein